MFLTSIKIQIKKMMLYKESVLANIIFSLFAIWIMYSLYSLLPNKEFSQKYILSYVIISVFFEQSIATTRIPIFCKNIKKGLIIKYYKYPMSIYKQFIYEEIGETFFCAMSSCPLLFIVFLLFKRNVVTVIAFILSLFIGLMISILLTLDVYSIAFLLWNYKSSKAILTACCGFFSGTMIPLIFLPEWFNEIAYYTPFSYIVDCPIKILLNDNINFRGIGIQCAWILLLYLLGILIYRRNESKMNIYGG